MKVLNISDLHLEFKKEIKLDPIFFDDYDLCIVAGDFSNFLNFKNHVKNFCSLIFPKKVIFVAGNHEFYGSKLYYNQLRKISNIMFEENINYFNSAKNYLKNCIEFNENAYFLDNSFVTINDINFYGGTLWCNSNKDSFAPINDQTFIDYSPFKDIREIYKNEYNKFKKNLVNFLNNYKGQNNVVISHFSPSEKLRNFNFDNENNKDNKILKYFSADLDDILLSENAPSYWFYGHNHYSQKLRFNKCLAISKQIGYSEENNEKLEILKIF